MCSSGVSQRFEQSYLQNLGLFCPSLLPKILHFTVQLLWMPHILYSGSPIIWYILVGFSHFACQLYPTLRLKAIKMEKLPHTISFFYLLTVLWYLANVIFSLVPWVVVLYYSVQSVQLLFIGAWSDRSYSVITKSGSLAMFSDRNSYLCISDFPSFATDM